MVEVDAEALGHDAFFFQPESKVRWIGESLVNYASDNFDGESEPEAIPFYYYLQEGVEGPVTFTVYQGNFTIAELTGDAEAGIHRVLWGMDKVQPMTPEQQAQMEERAARFGRAFRAPSDPAPLGDYRVVMTIGDRVVGEREVSILRDDWWMLRR
jgi:hypothetical protein